MANYWNILSLSLLCAFHSVAANDPTAPLNWVSSDDKKAELEKVNRVPELQSIMCQSKTCFAILDDKIANVNDIISGYRVRTINSEEVIVTKGSTTRNLTLFVSDIKNGK